MDVDEDGQHAVSGEMGRDSAVWVWKIEDGVSVVKLSGVHKKGISAVAFGRGDGSRVVSVGADDDHYLCIWDWKNGTGKVAGVNTYIHNTYKLAVETSLARSKA
jgi:WD40 repeat protein